MPVNLYYTQRVRGFQQESVKYSKESVEICLKRTKHQCPHCGSTSVTVERGPSPITPIFTILLFIYFSNQLFQQQLEPLWIIYLIYQRIF